MRKTWLLPLVLLFSLSSCLEDLDFDLPTLIGTTEVGFSSSNNSWDSDIVGLTKTAIDSNQVGYALGAMESDNVSGKFHQGGIVQFKSTMNDKYEPYVFIYQKISTYNDGVAFEPNKTYQLSPRGVFCHQFIGEKPYTSAYASEYVFKWTALTNKPEIEEGEDKILEFKDLDLDSSQDFFELQMGFYEAQKSGDEYTWNWDIGLYTFKKVTADAEGNIWILMGIQRTVDDTIKPSETSYNHLFDEIHMDVYEY